MAFSRRASASVMGVMLLVAATVLTACASAAPSARPVPRRSPSPSSAVVAYAVPPVQPGELARIVYAPPGAEDGVSVHVPASRVGYDIDYGCKAVSAGHKLGFELLHGTTMIVAGSTACDGIAYRDTAVVPNTPAETVHIVFTGDMSQVADAYLVLVPANDN